MRSLYCDIDHDRAHSAFLVVRSFLPLSQMQAISFVHADYLKGSASKATSHSNLMCQHIFRADGNALPDLLMSPIRKDVKCGSDQNPGRKKPRMLL